MNDGHTPFPAGPQPEARLAAIRAKDWLDVDEVCLLLNISRRTLYNWKYQRKISWSRVNGKVYFSKRWILQELKRNEVLSPVRAWARHDGRELAG